jgi:metallophosphoesterase (TIGR00282 family)
MNLLFIGDVFGRPGRQILKNKLPELKHRYQADVCIVNAENASGGSGLLPEAADEILNAGADALTLGNHTWSKKDIQKVFEKSDRVIRPANYLAHSANPTPGKGTCIVEAAGKRIGVMNLLGRVFMGSVDCPFQCADQRISDFGDDVDYIFLDFHAEATSEKIAMGWYLDGRVAAVVGTHTHVATADNRVLPGGTAYMTDVGMTGPHESVIGVKTESALHRFLTGRPARFEPAKGDVQLHGVHIVLDPNTGLAKSIERIDEREKNE